MLLGSSLGRDADVHLFLHADLTAQECPFLGGKCRRDDVPPDAPAGTDFDLLRVYSEGSDKDFVTPDLDDDGVDDDPSVRRTFVLPHVLEVSGRCIGRSKEDVYVWKIKAVDSNGEKIRDVPNNFKRLRTFILRSPLEEGLTLTGQR